ncbi:hypothetical protein BKA70DRAFT_1337429 [Coprinopsis sp. MPI-PUGE-AT-0042]|nr:hypothetical protein BKA70DRAFT_1337429 [Coprinopsis sp. MPI-PUGE-AT-0042]
MAEEDKVILKLEHSDPATSLPNQQLNSGAGYVNWTVMAIPPSDAHRHFARNRPVPCTMPRGSMLSVLEGPLRLLGAQTPQAVLHMLRRAKETKKSVVRGVLTNGREWIFLILILDESGGRCAYSDTVMAHDIVNCRPVLSREFVSTIVAILAYWTKHSHEDYNPATDPFFEAESI